MSTEFITNLSIIIATVISNTIIFTKVLLSKLKGITCQVSPNGGSSLHDMIKRMEKMLTLNTYWLHTFQQVYDKPLFKTDEEGRCTWANSSYCKLTGTSTNDIEGNNWVAVIHPDDKEKVAAEWFSSVSKKRLFDMVYRIRNLVTGKIITVKGQAFPVLINEKLVGYTGTLIPLE